MNPPLAVSSNSNSKGSGMSARIKPGLLFQLFVCLSGSKGRRLFLFIVQMKPQTETSNYRLRNLQINLPNFAHLTLDFEVR